jgi:hypothetical protein
MAGQNSRSLGKNQTHERYPLAREYHQPNVISLILSIIYLRHLERAWGE